MQKYQVQSTGVKLQVFASRTESFKVLLFIHGAAENGVWSLIMQKAIQQLSKEYRCVFYDQRGCGLSTYDLSDGITKEDVMEDIYHVIHDIKKQRQKQKLILIGDSLGGLFALQCLQQYPQLFDGMILSDPLLILDHEEDHLLFAMIKRHYQMNKTHEFQKLFDILNEETPKAFFTNPVVRDYIFSNRNSSHALRFIAAISKWLFDTSCMEALERTTIPTLIMKGRDENVTHEEHILNILVQLQNPFIIYESFPDCIHAIYEDQPMAFIDRIRRFLVEEFPCD